jgi:hypothetical protein
VLIKVFLRPEKHLILDHGQEAEVVEDDEHIDASIMSIQFNSIQFNSKIK